ncbi:MAG TPA: sigma-70 family RNA polymerase sigma factor [Thermodesulfobacteriota bacterium]|nr:sigma-70 family RNA polymerase sigma factor [Thermodesulfobacteriota bacterium]
MRESDQITTDEDLRLVSLCQKGDLGAFEELVRKHERKMLNIAFRMIGSYEEACDIVQDAFISAYKNIRSFKGMSKFSTWLSTIVINLSKKRLEQLRTQRRREPVSIDEPINAEANRTRVESPSDNFAADEVLQKKEIQEKVQLCLDRLDNEFREVVILRDVQGFSYEDICSTLKIAEGTVKSRLFRGRVLLKNCLKRFVGVL